MIHILCYFREDHDVTFYYLSINHQESPGVYFYQSQ